MAAMDKDWIATRKKKKRRSMSLSRGCGWVPPNSLFLKVVLDPRL